MKITKLIISSLLLVPVMGFSVDIARGVETRGGEYHGSYDQHGYGEYHPNMNAYPGVDRAAENRVIENRAIDNAAAAGAGAAAVGNEYVPVPQPQTQAPTINIYTPQVAPQK